eukprot:TRINITY_DN93545_c0_g1_i1.p1 TRINITY_DN93545_c0_g1~~TRINITY_DN93545_c0_g1_i1.p1  ORF type:complete len:183 (-),score=17.60 TRINITY_DN93545_c0_g1_i1:104-652(-)
MSGIFSWCWTFLFGSGQHKPLSHEQQRRNRRNEYHLYDDSDSSDGESRPPVPEGDTEAGIRTVTSAEKLQQVPTDIKHALLATTTIPTPLLTIYPEWKDNVPCCLSHECKEPCSLKVHVGAACELDGDINDNPTILSSGELYYYLPPVGVFEYVDGDGIQVIEFEDLESLLLGRGTTVHSVA